MKNNGKVKTLLQFAGAPSVDANPDNSILILIDYQNEYIDGSLHLPEGIAASRVAAELLEKFRSSEAPVVHVVHHSKLGAPLFDPETDNVNIIPILAPKEGEHVVKKGLPSAFAQTNLESIIRSYDRTKLVICGFMTHMCVESTVRMASELGFANVVVANACASRDLPNPASSGDIVSAEDIHSSALAAISDRFATIVPNLDHV